MIGKSKFAMTVALMTVMAMCFAGIVVDDSVDAAETTFNVTYQIDGMEDVVVPAVDAGEGVWTATVQSPEDLKITIPEGKKFVNWTDSEGKVVEIGTVINTETTLIAELTYQTYTITFMDGETVIGTQSCVINQTVTVPEAPAKEGMTFKGWRINGVDVIEIPTVTADATYVAVYEVNMYTITFMDGDRVVHTFEIEHGKTITLGDVPAGFDWDFDFTVPITEDVTINPVVEVEPEPEPAPAEPEDNSTTYALLAVLAIIVVVGLFIAVWYIKKEKD